MFLWWLRNGDATARKLARAVHEVGERSAEEKINREFGKLDGCHSCSYRILLCAQRGCIDSVECGTVEWNSGTVE